jgi:type IV pilus assembly protein PilB
MFGDGSASMDIIADQQGAAAPASVGADEDFLSSPAPARAVAHDPVAPDPVASVSPEVISHAETAPAVEVPSDVAVPVPVYSDSPGESGLGKAPKQGKPMRIGERLIHLGLIGKDQLEIALREQQKSKKLLGQIMVEMSFITESALGEVLAQSSGAEKFDSKTTMLDPSVLRQVPLEICMRNKVIPISNENGVVKVAIADVYNVLAIDQIKRHFDKGTKIVPLYASEPEINELIERNYNYDMSIDGILREIETGIREKGQLDGQEEGYTNPTVRLVNALLVDAIKRGASDIHFEPEGSFLRLRYRIDGSLQQVRSFHRDYWPAMLVRMKIMAGMNIAETRNPQDGRIGLTALGREVDFRVATQPTVHGENVVLRILDKSRSLVPLEDLGFSEHNMVTLKRCLMRPEGIVIVTGPTGSGKTTTLYSVLSYINSIDVNIMTLEDPVEYQLPLIRQTSVREGTIDFQSGIKSLMRQDPDIIFVGEVRDEETAIMAVRAALTGHQVFTTLHTNDALGAIPRLGDIGVPPHLLAGSLICTVAQRLARKLCSHCKKPCEATHEECRMLGVDVASPPIIHEAVGCEHCGFKGYRGRTAVLEVLRIDKGMDELIATRATRNQMLEYALSQGFVPMVQDGIGKILSGEIDLAELMNTVDLTDRIQ